MVSSTEWWQAQESLPAAEKWLHAHPPAHLRPAGSARSGKAGSKPTAVTSIYADANYAGATLQMGVAEGPDGRTYWAAQALMRLVDRQPIRFDNHGCVRPYSAADAPPVTRLPARPGRLSGTAVCGAVNASGPPVANNRASGNLPHAVDSPVPPINDGTPRLTNGGTRAVTRPGAP